MGLIGAVKFQFGFADSFPIVKQITPNRCIFIHVFFSSNQADLFNQTVGTEYVIHSSPLVIGVPTCNAPLEVQLVLN